MKALNMKSRVHYVASETVAREASKLIAETFDISVRFPKQVFRTMYNEYLFSDYDWLLSARFWDWIEKNESTKFDEILIYVIDPDPFEYFYANFGKFNILRLEAGATSAEYISAIKDFPSEWSPDSIMLSSSVIVVLPKSKSWGIWGERRTNLCVLGSAGWPTKVGIAGPWKTLQGALDGWVGLEFEGFCVPSDFRQAMIQSFGRCPNMQSEEM